MSQPVQTLNHTLLPTHAHVSTCSTHTTPGIVPVTCSWATLTREWAEAFPGVQPSLLVSSVIHFVPLLRDLAQLMGSFEVSKEGFVAALDMVSQSIATTGRERLDIIF